MKFHLIIASGSGLRLSDPTPMANDYAVIFVNINACNF